MIHTKTETQPTKERHKMKKSTINIYLNIKSSRNFENKVSQFFPKGSEVEISDITLFSFSGYGQYKDYLYLTVDEKEVRIYDYHTNAPQKDWYSSDEFDSLGKRTQDNFIKNKVLTILESNANYLMDING